MLLGILFHCFFLLSQEKDSTHVDNIILIGAPEPQYAELEREKVVYNTIIERMRMSYTPPSFFEKNTNTRECFEYSTKMWISFGCNFPFFISKDKEMLVFLDAYNEGQNNYISKEEFLEQGLLYLGEKASMKWEDYVTYYPKNETKRIFNADTVIQYTITLLPKDFYKKNEKKYKYVDVLFIEKKGRGYVYFYSFYTDKAKKNITSYRKQIETIVRYED